MIPVEKTVVKAKGSLPTYITACTVWRRQTYKMICTMERLIFAESEIAYLYNVG